MMEGNVFEVPRGNKDAEPPAERHDQRDQGKDSIERTKEIRPEEYLARGTKLLHDMAAEIRERRDKDLVKGLMQPLLEKGPGEGEAIVRTYWAKGLDIIADGLEKDMADVVQEAKEKGMTPELMAKLKHEYWIAKLKSTILGALFKYTPLSTPYDAGFDALTDVETHLYHVYCRQAEMDEKRLLLERIKRGDPDAREMLERVENIRKDRIEGRLMAAKSQDWIKRQMALSKSKPR